MSLSTKSPGFSTNAIHHGYDAQANLGALNPPLYLSSTFAFDNAEQGGERFAGEQPGYIYSRLGNPTNSLLESRLAVLEGAESCVCTGSGMGAITSLMWTLLTPGDEIIVDKTLYGCTFSFFNHGLSRHGIQVTHVDMTSVEAVHQAISPKTKVVYFETPANPNMRLIDIQAISAIAHQQQAWVIVDNTYCTPYLQRPMELGADFVVHSATKYLNGHGDLIAGAILGPQEQMDQVRMFGVKDMTGSVLSPQDAYLIMRGLKTLAIRMQRHSSSALVIAEYLQGHPLIDKVHYPGLASFPQSELAARQMSLSGGMLAFELKAGRSGGIEFMNNLQLIQRAVSLGDAETLAQHPASMTHSTYSEEERQLHLISEGLIRLSAGLEEVDDLLEDIEQALDRTTSVRCAA